MLPTASSDLKALSLADSVAIDPHKWLYAPLEAGCALVRNRQALQDAFTYHPTYYQFDAGEEPLTTTNMVRKIRADFAPSRCGWRCDRLDARAMNA